MKKLIGCAVVVVVILALAGAVGVFLNLDTDSLSSENIESESEVSEEVPEPSEPKVSREIERIQNNQDLWPQTVSASVPVDLSISSGGQIVGSMTAPPGKALEVVTIHEGIIQVKSGEAQGSVHVAQTNLVEQSERKKDQEDELAESEQKKIAKEFMKGAASAGWVTHIEQDPRVANHFHVRLPVEKYTTKENVKNIAEYIAKSYVRQSVNKGGSARSATIHVFQGNKVLVRGSYRE